MRSDRYAPTYRSGECDICHREVYVSLHAFEDDDPGEWEMCEGCADRIARKRRRMNQDERERGARMGAHYYQNGSD